MSDVRLDELVHIQLSFEITLIGLMSVKYDCNIIVRSTFLTQT